MHFSRKIKLLTLIILSLSVIFIYKATNHNNINYTTLGDGFAKGIDCYGRIDYGYNDYVKDYLIETKKLKGYSNTFTSEDMTIERLLNTFLINEKVSEENKKENIREILRDTDYLTISVGLNDLLYKISLSNEPSSQNLDFIISEIKISFNTLIDEIRKVYSRPIYVIGYYDAPIKNTYLQNAIRELNSIYEENSDVTYISTYAISENSSVFLPNPNSYYPNYKGYRLISTKIVSKISKKLAN